jgi:hypothetical protein
MSDILIRNATIADLEGVMDVEKEWPVEQRATLDKFKARLEKFPEGFFVAEGNGEIVGTCTSCVTNYSFENPKLLGTWDKATNFGYLIEPKRIEYPNAIYIVSGIVKREWRNKGVYLPLLAQAQVNLSRSMGFKFTIAGAIIPGYSDYCEKHGHIKAEDYVFLKHGKKLVDPFLERYRQFGFTVPDKNHVMENYYPDIPSRNYAALVIHKSGQ